MAEDIKALDGVYNFSDARRVIEEVWAIQKEGQSSILPAHTSPVVEAYWQGRLDMMQALSLVVTNEEFMQNFLREADEREDAARA